MTLMFEASFSPDVMQLPHLDHWEIQLDFWGKIGQILAQTVGKANARMEWSNVIFCDLGFFGWKDGVC